MRFDIPKHIVVIVALVTILPYILLLTQPAFLFHDGGGGDGRGGHRGDSEDDLLYGSSDSDDDGIVRLDPNGLVIPSQQQSSSIYSQPPIPTVGDYIHHYEAYSAKYNFRTNMTFGGSTRRTIVVWALYSPSSGQFHAIADRLRRTFTEDEVIEVTPSLPLDGLLDALTRSRVIAYPALPLGSRPEDGAFILAESMKVLIRKNTEMIPVSLDEDGRVASPIMEVVEAMRLAAIVNRPKVFILSLPRSGSSFVGEIFKQNLAFKYLFEPSHNGWAQLDNCEWNKKTVKLGAEKLWKDIYFNCSLTNVTAYRQKDFWPLHPEYYWTKEYEQTEQDCHNTIFAVKEVAVWWSKLEWLYKVLGPNTKFIYLVRDPRNWVSSWTYINSKGQSFYKDWGYQDRSLMVLCNNQPISSDYEQLKDVLTDTKAPAHKRMAAQWQVFNSKVYEALQNIPEENRMVVNLERLLVDPQPHVTDIYKFIDMPLPARVSDWVERNTQGGDEDRRYSTSRNSTKMASIWRERLSVEEIRDIETITSDMMNKLDKSATTQT